MKVILTEDVKSLGKKGDLVDVSDGYARNFILSKKKGLEATPANLNSLKLKKANDEKVAQEQLDAVSGALASDGRILSWEMKSPEQNYNSFKENLGDRASLLDEIDYNKIIPYTFSILLNNPGDADSVISDIGLYEGISKIEQESNVMKFLTKSTRIVNIATLVSFVVLFIISLFIISNMVRI